MKILLLGEYSRLHNSLKEGLTHLGHEVILVSSGDYFKKFDSDYSFRARFLSDYWLLRKFKNAFHKGTGIDLEKAERGIRFYVLLRELKHFDHIQFINSDAIETFPWLSRICYEKLCNHIKSRSLLLCGDETPVIDYLLRKKLKYSILSPYLNDQSLEKHFEFSLKYTKKPYRKTFDWLVQKCQKLIASDLDYKIPMDKMGFPIVLIPNPVNTNRIAFEDLEIASKTIIFLGINRGSYVKKGIVFFEKALAIIQLKYPDTVEIITTENCPYQEYIQLYHKAHIVLDQIYAFDQGYNALEAMAKGKAVFTGAEAEFTQHYKLQQRVCVNALPNVDSLVAELSFLIDNPNEIIAIGKRARVFIEEEHDCIKIAERYLEVWK